MMPPAVAEAAYATPPPVTRHRMISGESGMGTAQRTGGLRPGRAATFAISIGIISGMKTTIDAAGRLVIPKALRRQAGIEPGMPLDVRVKDGHIEIEPSMAHIELERRGRFLVAVSDMEAPPLTNDQVEDIRETLRQERARDGQT
jgi:AbrB family looped-hinge helix DNA binding protein